MLALSLKTPADVQQELAARLKARRLALNLSQQGLARRSAVSLGSIKRFEHTGQISLASLLKLSLVLEALEDFETVFRAKTPALSLDDLIAAPRTRQKGLLK